MIVLATILGAIQDFALVGVLAILVWLARKDYPCRAVRWLARKFRGESASPSPAHPAAKAAVNEEFKGLERQYWDVPAVADSDRLTPRGEA